MPYNCERRREMTRIQSLPAHHQDSALSAVWEASRRKPVVCARNEGDRVVILGQTVICKVTSEDTEGAYALFEIESAPLSGLPRMLHRREEEVFFVLEGLFTITIGEEVYTARAGDFVLAPRCVPHSFRNISDAPGRLLVLASPGGIEGWFAEMAQLPSPYGEPDRETVARLMRKYGLEAP
jgi:mannose-6-phosphate isomerase-like protein (cupin superfamily)